MEISKEEKLMYGVMRAIYESGIPISFKGAMVLKACLKEAGFSGDIRHTNDIDADWCSEPDVTEMKASIQRVLDEA